MLKKSPKIILLVFLFLAVFSFDFQAIGKIAFSSAGKDNKPISFVSQVQAKKKKAKKKKKKVKKISKNEIGENIEIPIVVSGDDICQKNTRQALKELFEKDDDDFQLVISRLGKIECVASGSGVYVWEDPPRFKVGVATYNASSIWYASVLAHESCHVGQFRRSADKSQPDNVSQKEYSGEKAEKECLDVQIGALKKLKAGSPMINYVENILASEYWLTNADERWW